jgi:hypothetical protein
VGGSVVAAQGQWCGSPLACTEPAFKWSVKLLVGFSIGVAVVVTYWYSHQPLRYPAGVLVNSEPEQVLLPQNASCIAHGLFMLKPLATFSVEARVLHRRNYRYDAGAALVPVDLALGWGVMSDQHVLDQLHISQSLRCYWYEYRLPPPVPVNDIASHSANMHIIPATPEIDSRCKSLRAGSLVHLTGELVEATGPGIGTWRSSLTRSDSGNGACELFYVEAITGIEPNGALKASQLVTER